MATVIQPHVPFEKSEIALVQKRIGKNADFRISDLHQFVVDTVAKELAGMKSAEDGQVFTAPGDKASPEPAYTGGIQISKEGDQQEKGIQTRRGALNEQMNTTAPVSTSTTEPQPTKADEQVAPFTQEQAQEYQTPQAAQSPDPQEQAGETALDEAAADKGPEPEPAGKPSESVNDFEDTKAKTEPAGQSGESAETKSVEQKSKK